ncbi:MAG: hypothetical protein M1334_02920 [Patescibacteria group bacterium]|nr:hypothetical protein [Patescibacteria group bacterium]
MGREYEPLKVDYPYVTMRILAYEFTFVRTKDGVVILSSGSQSQIAGDTGVTSALINRATRQAIAILKGREKKMKAEARQGKLL